MVAGSAPLSTRACASSSADSRSPTSPASRPSSSVRRLRRVQLFNGDGRLYCDPAVEHVLHHGQIWFPAVDAGCVGQKDHRFSRSTPRTAGASAASYWGTWLMMSASTQKRLVALPNRHVRGWGSDRRQPGFPLNHGSQAASPGKSSRAASAGKSSRAASAGTTSRAAPARKIGIRPGERDGATYDGPIGGSLVWSR
jgi:hypothetical protein